MADAPITDVHRGTAEGWPFWAPSDDESVLQALHLAAIQPGERVADLGCGDGRVLLAAAQLGADVIGVESDPALAAAARAALAGAGVAGTVLESDLFAVDLEVDVVFCYLAPATLQRLVGRLRPGVRVVTVDFAIPGAVPAAVEGAAHLYRTPVDRDTDVDVAMGALDRTPGWHADGTLVVAPPDVESLTTLELVHPGGPVEAALGPTLTPHGRLATGADWSEPGAVVAIDLVWQPGERGAAHVGTLRVAGLAPHAVIVVREDWTEAGAQWDLTGEGAASMAAWIASHHGPHTLDALLTAAGA